VNHHLICSDEVAEYKKPWPSRPPLSKKGDDRQTEKSHRPFSTETGVLGAYGDPTPSIGKVAQLDLSLIPTATLTNPLAKGGLPAWQIRLIDKHIQDNLEKTIRVGALADIAGLSRGHFCRAFKIATGDTAHTYVLRKRIERAQTRMTSTRDALSQIACECGLVDQAHLTRLFRKFVGQTPLVWRKARRNGLEAVASAAPY
jgi:AraC-like DNA-binding protein